MTNKKPIRTNSSKFISPQQEFDLARSGLIVGAAALFLSTAYMNVSGWVAQAEGAAQAIANGMLASSFELMALFGLSWAGFQYARGRKGAATIAASIAIVAIIFNTLAAQNFLHLQAEDVANAIETSGMTATLNQSEIDALQSEVASIKEQNDGHIPRPVEAIEAEYSRYDAENHPRKIAKRDAEIALRLEYERLQSQISALRREAAIAAVQSNDSGRTVVPTAMLGPFVWALEIIKGTIFFALGTATGRKPQTKEERKKWAIIQAKEDTADKSERSSAEIDRKSDQVIGYRKQRQRNHNRMRSDGAQFTAG